jgi:uncharacterized RDD family membrane protein YckC
MDAQAQIRPGGFWIRFLAAIIDGMIVGIPSFVINAIFGAIVGIITRGQNSALFGIFAWTMGTAIGVLISLAYHTYYYQKTGSTLGKKVFNLKVVDARTGALLSFKQVFLREVVGKFLSSATFMIGYIMAGVRQDKRALHDLIADTQVLEINQFPNFSFNVGATSPEASTSSSGPLPQP